MERSGLLERHIVEEQVVFGQVHILGGNLGLSGEDAKERKDVDDPRCGGRTSTSGRVPTNTPPRASLGEYKHQMTNCSHYQMLTHSRMCAGCETPPSLESRRN